MRGVDIRMIGMSADAAQEFGLRTTISRLNMTANRAALARIARVYQNDRYPGHARLVLDELAQLSETPIAASGSFRFASNPGPRANAIQVFDGNSSVRAFGQRNETPGNHMIGIGLETLLASRQVFQLTASALGAHALQFFALARVLALMALHRMARADIAVAVSSDVANAQINAKRILDFALVRVRDVADGQQIEHLTLALIDQIGLALAIAQQFKLACTRLIGNALASAQGPNRDDLIIVLPTEDAIIVGNRAVWSEGALFILVERVSVGNFGNAADDHLRTQFRGLANGVVDKILDVVATKGALLPRLLTDGVAQFIGSFQCLKQPIVLLRQRGNELDLSNDLHSMKGNLFIRVSQAKGGLAHLRSVPQHKVGGVPVPRFVKRRLALITRRDLLKRSAVAGVSLVSFSSLFGIRSVLGGNDSEGDDVETILNLAATAETLACTLYYAVLTTGEIPFTEVDVFYLTSALDAELQHLEFLNANGGEALTEEFYFPEDVFTDLSVFVPTTEALETAFVAAYLAATRRAAELGNPLLATTAAQVAAIEAQHLALVRVMGDLQPANNISLAEAKLYNVSDAVPLLQPFLEGGDDLVGPEPYLGGEEMRNLLGENRITSILPATDPDAFPDQED